MTGPNSDAGENAEVFTVKVETTAWINTFLDEGAPGSRIFEETAHPGDRVRDILRRLSGRYPKLSAALWEGDQIGPHIEIIVNETILGVVYNLDSPIQPGDGILLTGQYMGG